MSYALSLPDTSCLTPGDYPLDITPPAIDPAPDYCDATPVLPTLDDRIEVFMLTENGFYAEVVTEIWPVIMYFIDYDVCDTETFDMYFETWFFDPSFVAAYTSAMLQPGSDEER